MKTIILGIVAFLFSLNIQAQNQNVKTEVKTTVTTVKDSEGEKKLVKKEEVQEIQNIELKDAESKVLNKDLKETPVEVISKTEVSVDGLTRVVDVDRSAYYILDGQKYQISLDKDGYKMTNPNSKKLALLRKTSNNNYIYRNNNKISLGYFDQDGNLILETYDEKTDKITLEKFSLAKE
ncbi:hypothetical protein [Flavobacterium sp.]|uniref:hypothetical protein n=1 Tax=Flavobacterium sp. TaxID=239 RepID=UPI002B4B5743|nr:hypothetical protein [Flavobacterium sp.]HLF53166.1 hypothetical protein [Flavobacterium sp.]